MKTIKVTRSTVCAGKDLIAGKTYELEDKNANLLVGLGKAIEVEDETDVKINQDEDKKQKPIEKMNKKELLEYCEELGLEVDDSFKNAELIQAINDFLEDEE